MRSQITILLQDSILFAESIKDNISCGLQNISDNKIIEAAVLANAHEFISSFPNGFDTVVGERGTTLSNGQRQRIAIARAILRDAPILILDEPTVSLDENNELKVSQATEQLRKSRTTILVTHKLKQAINADQILYIKDGEILHRGDHNKLILLCKDYRLQYYLQNPTERESENKIYAVPN